MIEARMPLTLDEADGYLELKIPVRGADGQPETVTVWLDLYEANGKYAQLCDEFPPTEKPIELQAAWLEWLVTEKGVPPISQANALLVLSRVVEEIAEFKKKHAPGSETADSPASSTSPGSPGPLPT